MGLKIGESALWLQHSPKSTFLQGLGGARSPLWTVHPSHCLRPGAVLRVSGVSDERCRDVDLWGGPHIWRHLTGLEFYFAGGRVLGDEVDPPHIYLDFYGPGGGDVIMSKRTFKNTSSDKKTFITCSLNAQMKE